MAGPPPVAELRFVVTAEDYEAVLHFYRNVFGLPELVDFSTRTARRGCWMLAGRLLG